MIDNTMYALCEFPIKMAIWLNIVPCDIRSRFFNVDLQQLIIFNLMIQLDNELDLLWNVWSNKEIHLNDLQQACEFVGQYY